MKCQWRTLGTGEPGATRWKSEGVFLGGTDAQDDLERDLEREVVKQLHGENLRLKEKLREMEEKERKSVSGWSEVTAGEWTPKPPPPPE